ncbi:hypothetical protein [Natronococcus sp. JC468]|uniref:hypothetical protein n=1 Tax=Natronococcus sp. JC468 TaxID=1961921 RepID=UPI001FD836C3|nr:hypothetical protein [Natronococcus sp. JC468]
MSLPTIVWGVNNDHYKAIGRSATTPVPKGSPPNASEPRRRSRRGTTDARIVAEDGEIHGSIAGAGEPRLGESRDRAARLADHDGIDHASPVLEEPIRVAGDGDGAYLALIGAVPGPDSATVASLPLEALEA